MATQVLRALQADNDVLLVEGRVDWSDEDVFAQGWVSALTNVFDSADYVEDPEHPWLGVQLREGATPREMTPEERLAYCRRLLEEQNPPPPPEPVDLQIAG